MIFLFVFLSVSLIAQKGQIKPYVLYYKSDSTIQEVGNFKYKILNDKTTRIKHGEWKYYHQNGQLQKVETYKNGQIIGEVKIFSANGLLLWEKGDKSKKANVDKSYSNNGEIFERISYQYNTKHGKYYIYYSTGELNTIGNYIDGKVSGTVLTYYKNGNLMAEETFQLNKPNGMRKFYYENGKVKEASTIRENQLSGEYKSYHANGHLVSKGIYENGKRHNQWTHYYSNGKIEQSGMYIIGVKEGTWEKYDDTGKITHLLIFEKGRLIKTIKK